MMIDYSGICILIIQILHLILCSVESYEDVENVDTVRYDNHEDSLAPSTEILRRSSRPTRPPIWQKDYEMSLIALPFIPYRTMFSTILLVLHINVLLIAQIKLLSQIISLRPLRMNIGYHERKKLMPQRKIRPGFQFPFYQVNMRQGVNGSIKQNINLTALHKYIRLDQFLKVIVKRKELYFLPSRKNGHYSYPFSHCSKTELHIILYGCLYCIFAG